MQLKSIYSLVLVLATIPAAVLASWHWLLDDAVSVQNPLATDTLIVPATPTLFTNNTSVARLTLPPTVPAGRAERSN